MRPIEEIFHIKLSEKVLNSEKLIDRLCFLFARNKGSLEVKGWGKGYSLNEIEAFELTHYAGVLYGYCFTSFKETDRKWQNENIMKPLINRAKELGYIKPGYNPFPPDEEKPTENIKD